jgi:hypothetical protein
VALRAWDPRADPILSHGSSLELTLRFPPAIHPVQGHRVSQADGRF